jgi:hypothetical protein
MQIRFKAVSSLSSDTKIYAVGGHEHLRTP